jgi:peptidoglycan/LPS O-acetylase OafA/YrhL
MIPPKDLQTNSGNSPRHFYSLDALRGAAAVVVAIYHYGLFFCGTMNATSGDPTPPLYFLLRPFYLCGFRAVDLFFCLSGFIFFWLYSEKIATRRISIKKFGVLRFSRLYPLHFVSLLAAAGAHWLLTNRSGVSSIDGDFNIFHFRVHNDIFHFVLQLFFASNWMQQIGVSFNVPIWSVSIEVLLYAFFFLICSLRINRWWCLVVIILMGYVLGCLGQPDLSRGIFSFFLGGLSYHVFYYLLRRELIPFYGRNIVLLTALMWILISILSNLDVYYRACLTSTLGSTLSIHDPAAIGYVLLRLINSFCRFTLFPLTILSLAICEVSWGSLGKRLSFLGDISYSIYLLHFPFILLIATAVLTFSISTAIFSSPWMLLGFLGVLLPVSWCSYHFFERPAQDWLRTRLL